MQSAKPLCGNRGTRLELTRTTLSLMNVLRSAMTRKCCRDAVFRPTTRSLEESHSPDRALESACSSEIREGLTSWEMKELTRKARGEVQRCRGKSPV